MKNLLLLMLFMLSAWSALAQNVVSGVVLDSSTGKQMVGVAVTIANTTQGTITDTNGRFSLNSNSYPITIEVSYVGYQTQTLQVNQQAEPLRITLQSTVANDIDDDNSDFTFTENLRVRD